MSIFDRAFPAEHIAAIFGPRSDSRKAVELKRTDPATYHAMKKQAVADGLLDAPRGFQRVKQQPSREHFTNAEQVSMAEFSKAECERLLKTKGTESGTANLGKMQRDDPQKYARFRLASQCHGILIPTAEPSFRDNSHKAQLREKQHRDSAEATGEHRFRLADAVADDLGVERGRLVSMKEFSKLVIEGGINKGQRIAREKAEAAARAKAEAQAAASKPAAEAQPQAPSTEVKEEAA